MDKLRQGGKGFKYEIPACVRGLPTSQVACALANPLLFFSPLYNSPHLAHQPSPWLGAKSPLYLSRSPASHQCWPQLPAQLLIDRLPGCLLFCWVIGVRVTVGGKGQTTEESRESMRGAEGKRVDKALGDNKTLQFYNMPVTARALSG